MIKTILNWIKMKILINKKGDINTTILLYIGALIVGALLLFVVLYYLFSTSQSKLDKIL